MTDVKRIAIYLTIIFVLSLSQPFLGQVLGQGGWLDSSRKKSDEELKQKLEIEKQVLEKEYVKVLQFLVKEYKELEEQENEVEKNEKALEERTKDGKLDEKLVSAKEDKVNYLVKKGEALYLALNECRVFLVERFKDEKKKKDVRKKLSIPLEKNYVKEECGELTFLAKKQVEEFLIAEKSVENKIFWYLSDYYGMTYRVGSLVEKVKKKIGDLLVDEEAKVVVYPDGLVEVWDCKAGQVKVEGFLRELVENDYYFYAYELVVKTEGKDYKYSGELLPLVESSLGTDGSIVGGEVVHDPTGKKVLVKIRFLKHGVYVDKVLMINEGETKKTVWDGEVCLELKLYDKKQDFLKNLKVSEPKFVSEETDTTSKGSDLKGGKDGS